MKLVSWNVNGIRAVVRNGFWDWLPAADPDILCLQETRIQAEQLTEEMRHPPGYQSIWHNGERKGYSGVATLCRQEPLAIREGMGWPEFDAEGRVLVTEHQGFTLVNAYFPSGRRGQERVAYKIAFYDALLDLCTDLRARGQRLIVCGDYNTAHQPIDLARPRQNVKTSGFLPEEREVLTRWLDWGFVDIYRHLHPDTEQYTWWTYRFDARARNVGWRIDYFLLAEDLLPYVQDAQILTDVMGSDHCPIELVLDLDM
ncbi:MAG: exodeoxyribonuclease III [Anaerolineae bacterium]|jgi:exodeoxyribonuclease-3